MKHKYVFKVKHGHYKENNRDQVIVTEDGFNRCIVVYHQNKIVHISNLFHPESMGSIVFRGKTFISHGDNVCMKLDDNTIELDSFDINALDAEFDKLLSKFTKEEVQEWLKLDRLNQHGK